LLTEEKLGTIAAAGLPIESFTRDGEINDVGIAAVIG
jgi:hypothetical protein